MAIALTQIALIQSALIQIALIHKNSDRPDHFLDQQHILSSRFCASLS